MHNHSYGNEFYLHRNKTIVFISMVNCALGLVMKLKRFSRACIGIKQSFSYQWLIVHLASSWNWKDFLELASGLLNVGFLLFPYFHWFYTPATLLWKLLTPSGIPSTSSREYRGSMEIFWTWYLCLIRYFRSTYWIGSWILVLGSGKLKIYIWML